MRYASAIIKSTRLSATEKIVALAIASFAGPLGCCPSLESISRRSSCSRRTVQRAIASLVSCGAIAKLAGAARKRPQYVFKIGCHGDIQDRVSDWHPSKADLAKDHDCIEQLERDKARREKGHARRTR